MPNIASRVRLSGTAVIVVCAALCAAPWSSVAAAKRHKKKAKATACPGLTLTGPHGGMVSQLRATGVGCDIATRVAQPSGEAVNKSYQAEGFNCSGASPGPSGQVTVWDCAHGKKQRITFIVM
jgi:hypothetical protein